MSGVPANELKILIAKSANQQAAVLSGLAAPAVEGEVDLVSSSASQNNQLRAEPNKACST